MSSIVLNVLDLVCYTFTYLDFETLLSIQRVNQLFYRAIHNKCSWSSLNTIHYPQQFLKQLHLSSVTEHMEVIPINAHQHIDPPPIFDLPTVLSQCLTRLTKSPYIHHLTIHDTLILDYISRQQPTLSPETLLLQQQLFEQPLVYYLTNSAFLYIQSLTLDIEHISIHTLQNISQLHSLTTLTFINPLSAELQPYLLSSISQLTQLRALSFTLDDKCIPFDSEQGIQVLKHLQINELHTLHLSGCYLNSRIAEQIATYLHESLTSLNLQSCLSTTTADDICLPFITKCTKLKQLYLSCTYVTAITIKEICKHLLDLQYLDLYGSIVTELDLQGLSLLSKLTYLDLNNIECALPQSIEKLIHLQTLIVPSGCSEGRFKYLSPLHALTCITGRPQSLTVEDYEILDSLPSLIKYEFHYVIARSPINNHFHSCSLQSIRLPSQCTETFFLACATLPCLTELRADSHTNFTDDTLITFCNGGQLPSLRIWDIHSPSFTNRGFAVLFQNLPNLTDLCMHSQYDDTTCLLLSEHCNQLHMFHGRATCNITDTGCTYLARLPLYDVSAIYSSPYISIYGWLTILAIPTLQQFFDNKLFLPIRADIPLNFPCVPRWAYLLLSQYQSPIPQFIGGYAGRQAAYEAIIQYLQHQKLTEQRDGMAMDIIVE